MDTSRMLVGEMTTPSDDLDPAAVEAFFAAECKRRVSYLRGKARRQAVALRLLQDKRCVEFAMTPDGEIDSSEIMFAGERWITKEQAAKLTWQAKLAEQSWEAKKNHHWRLGVAMWKIAATLRMSHLDHPEKYALAVAELVQENRRLRAALKMKLEDSNK